MKKKGLIILGGILIVTVMAAVCWFVLLSGKDEKMITTVELNGTWYVYQYAENKVDNEFMIFDNGVVSDYRDGNEKAYISSKYNYENGTLEMDEVEKKFSVHAISDNNIILVEPDTREWKMIRVAEAGQDIAAISISDLVGEYEVVMVAGEQRTGEVMVFNETKLTDMRDGEEYLTCNYELVGEHLLNAKDMSKEYYVYKNGSVLMLIDKTDGYVWELKEK